MSTYINRLYNVIFLKSHAQLGSGKESVKDEGLSTEPSSAKPYLSLPPLLMGLTILWAAPNSAGTGELVVSHVFP